MGHGTVNAFVQIFQLINLTITSFELHIHVHETWYVTLNKDEYHEWVSLSQNLHWRFCATSFSSDLLLNFTIHNGSTCLIFYQ